MTEKSVILEWDGGVATIRLNDPATRNAITLDMLGRLDAALDEVEARARAMVLTGEGGAFCSGANLSGGMGADGDPGDFDAGLVLETHVNPLMDRLRTFGVPWISAVRGGAAGVGASLAMAGDMIVASETAFFLQAFARVGLVPDGGSSHLLVRTIGRPRAMELMLLGERLPAAQALAWGLINRVVPDAALDTEAKALADRLAGGAASLGTIRKIAWVAVDGDLATAMAAERSAQVGAGRSADHQEGVAAFREKRPARFTGR